MGRPAQFTRPVDVGLPLGGEADGCEEPTEDALGHHEELTGLRDQDLLPRVGQMQDPDLHPIWGEGGLVADFRRLMDEPGDRLLLESRKLDLRERVIVIHRAQVLEHGPASLLDLVRADEARVGPRDADLQVDPDFVDEVQGDSNLLPAGIHDMQEHLLVRRQTIEGLRRIVDPRSEGKDVVEQVQLHQSVSAAQNLGYGCGFPPT